MAKRGESEIAGSPSGGRGAPDEGLFPSGSVTRRMYRHTAVILGWPRAILMQVAHPLVAQGVADHSSYGTEPVRRFMHTFDSALSIIFGTTEQAVRAAEVINQIHTRVEGHLRRPVGCWPPGTPYRAGDPALLLWVHATLIDSDVAAYERFVGSLSAEDKELCYRERIAPASLLGLKPESMPGSFEQMQVYIRDEIRSDRISVGDFQRELALRLLYPAIKGVPRFVFEPLVGLTAGLLPEELRAAYGLEMGRARKAAWTILPALVRRGLPLMPPTIRSYPVARARSILSPA